MAEMEPNSGAGDPRRGSAAKRLGQQITQSQLWRSIVRHGVPDTPRTRSLTVVSNIFLHLHPVSIPKRALRFTFTWGLGGISLLLFFILVITGVLLMFYYVPHVDRAYSDMKDLRFAVPFGVFLRNMHRWSAHAMVMVVILHMMRVFYTGSYRKPREFNWMVGVLLLVLTLALSFTGYLLPWDQLAYWAITVGTNMASATPFVGHTGPFHELLGIRADNDIRFALLGGTMVGQNALIRFYVLHDVALPIIMGLLLAVHFWRIRKDGGISRPENIAAANNDTLITGNSDTTTMADSGASQKIYTWPVVMVAELGILLLTAAVLLSMAFLFDAPLLEEANPAFPENPAKSPWYFLGIQELVSYSAFAGGVVIPLLFLTFLISIPYIDREDEHIGVWFSGRMGRHTTWRSILFAMIVTMALVFVIVRYG
ncbi:hypothetical protein LCGC14_2507560, partial [marine sediment metagenome]